MTDESIPSVEIRVEHDPLRAALAASRRDDVENMPVHFGVGGDIAIAERHSLSRKQQLERKRAAAAPQLRLQRLVVDDGLGR